MRSFIEYCETKLAQHADRLYGAVHNVLTWLDKARAAAVSGVYSQRIDLVNGYVSTTVPVRDLDDPHRYAAQNGRPRVPLYFVAYRRRANIQRMRCNVTYPKGTVWVERRSLHRAAQSHELVFETNVVFVNKILALRELPTALPQSVNDRLAKAPNRGIMCCNQNRTADRFILDGVLPSPMGMPPTRARALPDCRMAQLRRLDRPGYRTVGYCQHRAGAWWMPGGLRAAGIWAPSPGATRTNSDFSCRTA